MCASGPLQRAWLRAGVNSKATAGPAWLHVWPSAPCVVLGGQRHSIPWRHVCHPEHLVGGSPPQSLGSSCAYTGWRIGFEVCVARFQGPWPSQPLTPQRPQRLRKQGARWLPICSVSEVQAQRSCHHRAAQLEAIGVMSYIYPYITICTLSSGCLSGLTSTKCTRISSQLNTLFSWISKRLSQINFASCCVTTQLEGWCWEIVLLQFIKSWLW